MQERRVADGADHRPLLAGPGDSAPDGDRGTHADGGVDRPELEPEGVAPDVTWEDAVAEDLLHSVERRPVHAPGAEDRRTGRHPLDRCGRRIGYRGGYACILHGGGDRRGSEFSLIRHRAGHLAEDLRLRRHLAHRLLDDRGEFLDDEDVLVLVDEGPKPLLIDGVGADDRERDVIGEHLLDVGGGDAARDDGGPAPDGMAVVAEFDQPLSDRRLLLVQGFVEQAGVRGDDHILLRVAAEGCGPVFSADLSDVDIAL